MKKFFSILLTAWAMACLTPVLLADGADTSTVPIMVPPAVLTNADDTPVDPAARDAAAWVSQLTIARQQRIRKDYDMAVDTLTSILMTNAPVETQKSALLEMAYVYQDQSQFVRAQQIYSQYLHLYPDDSAIPDLLLRQGLLYRQMGVDSLAISKFYAVMSSALKLKLDNVSYYKGIVVRAQVEIADTYFLDAKYEQAADFYNRILKAGDAEDSREILECKLIRSLSYQTNYTDTVGKAQIFLSRFTNSTLVPEVRFILASALKSIGHNQDSMKQVLLLLQAEEANVSKDPQTWLYWQRRAGNDIANQLYKEGDSIDALSIYLSLADLDKTPGWQVPVWYQTGLVYEQLQQWQKATDIYGQILKREPELTNASPVLSSLMDMARWRQSYIAWAQKAQLSTVALQSPAPPASITNSTANMP